jgi:hypothetical protein
MFTPESLFIWNIENLIKYHDNPTPENLFLSVGPLRRILLDKTPLIHLANRNTKLKIIFTVVDPEIRLGAPQPASSSPRILKTMNLAEFLQHQLMQFRGTDITVKDAIDYVRNYAGLEHKNEPDTQAMKAAENVNAFQFGGAPAILFCLREAISLTLRGCEPLYGKLKEQQNKEHK